MKKFLNLALIGALLFSMASCEMYKQKSTSKYNKHDYVDLGLPSGTMWSTKNFGAAFAEYPGDRYQWGELNQVENYLQGKWDTDKKYVDAAAQPVLLAEDDIVSKKWGGKWRIPTAEEVQELIDNCKWTFDQKFDGFTIAGPNGNSIFIPRRGSDNVLYDATIGWEGYVWTATNAGENLAKALAFNRDGKKECINLLKNSGYEIRPVFSK